jgi:hypothetical protein
MPAGCHFSQNNLILGSEAVVSSVLLLTSLWKLAHDPLTFEIQEVLLCVPLAYFILFSMFFVSARGGPKLWELSSL